MYIPVCISFPGKVYQTGVLIPATAQGLKAAIDAKLGYNYHGGTGPNLRSEGVRE